MSAIYEALIPFCPINEWIPDQGNNCWPNSEKRMYVLDARTKVRYLNEHNIRIKCAAAALVTPLVYTIATVTYAVILLFKVLSGYEFWKNEDQKYNLKNRALNYGKDCLKLILSPFIMPALELAALWGIILPHDGRKVFTSIEIAYLGSNFITCFQPEPKGHLFGGRLNNPNAW